MKLAIHKSAWGFSDDWIAYCQVKGIAYKIVDCYATDIVTQVADCDVLLWHHHHTLAKDKVFAHQLLFALEQSGKKVFPDFKTGWHFDDKLGQKYLLEAIGAPIVPTYVFYAVDQAERWIASTSFPKVFKLRGGAGSSNVKLVKNAPEAKSLVRKAFGSGFASYDKWGNFKEVLRKYRLKQAPFQHVLKSLRRMVVSTEFARIHGPEKGYVLFQQFIPNNRFDIRAIVIGSKAFAIKRMVRDNDFRASGSGFIRYDKEEIDLRCIETAFSVTRKLGASCVAFDFVFDSQNNPLIVEINYGFAHDAYFDCPGYWDTDLLWHEGKFNSAHFIIDELLKVHS